MRIILDRHREDVDISSEATCVQRALERLRGPASPDSVTCRSHVYLTRADRDRADHAVLRDTQVPLESHLAHWAPHSVRGDADDVLGRQDRVRAENAVLRDRGEDVVD